MKVRAPHTGILVHALGLLACSSDPPVTFFDDGTGASTVDATSGTSEMPPEDESGPDASSESSEGEPPEFDVGAQPTDPTPKCEVVDELDGIGPCDVQAPPESFDPAVQWTWTGGEGGERAVIATPLVANLTDDNGDGAIDLCDTPDVVVLAGPDLFGFGLSQGHAYVLDGATGEVHVRFEEPVVLETSPALGDIDDDGIVELVAVGPDGRLHAWEHDGTHAWVSDEFYNHLAYGAVALADLDADGDVEIVAGDQVFDHEGKQLWRASPIGSPLNATTAADLDDDGDLEVVLGATAFHHDGSLMYDAGIAHGYAQVADLDGDGEPEILVTNIDGLALLEADGTIVYEGLRPIDAPAQDNVWHRPATVHDFDGDGLAEYAVSSLDSYSVYTGEGQVVWSAPVRDQSGNAAGTAFDFLGDGIAEAMYADETSLFVFGEGGEVLLETSRQSVTAIEYPVVADVDNDGSAEVVVVSNLGGYAPEPGFPTVQVIRDAEDRWIPARRIWNQHTYHVTNVREDGTIPQHEPQHWKTLNTFRTQAQIAADGSGTCRPAG